MIPEDVDQAHVDWRDAKRILLDHMRPLILASTEVCGVEAGRVELTAQDTIHCTFVSRRTSVRLQSMIEIRVSMSLNQQQVQNILGPDLYETFQAYNNHFELYQTAEDTESYRETLRSNRIWDPEVREAWSRREEYALERWIQKQPMSGVQGLNVYEGNGSELIPDQPDYLRDENG